jgi:putative two-component system response regulator
VENSPGAALAPASGLHAKPEELLMRQAGKILVVDDYEANLRGLGQLLRRANYSVSSATNGRDALDLVRRERPDLVLLDVLMPGLSGVDVCRELKRSADTCLTPVVLISGAQERATILAGLDAGADDFLNKPIDPEELYTRVRSLMRLKRVTDDLESAEALFLTLGRVIEARDPSTVGHCERLADYATALGRRLELPQADVDALYRGAFLHDIGKIAIPDRILLKKGRLTKKEYASMKRHAAIGDELCATVRSLDQVRPIVRHHHERIDGRGYPDGLRGDAIPLLAQIVSVVDIFDALTTDRPYRQALQMPTAYQMLRDEARGGWCQSSLIECFIDLHRGRETDLARTRVAV